MLAANRANAQKSTGPRTLCGKAQVTLNHLHHGRYAGRLFRSHLLLAHEDVTLYDWIYRQICYHFQPVGKRRWAVAEQAAREVWCAFRRARKGGLKAGHRPPSRTSVWSNMRIPVSRGGSGSNRICAVKSTQHFVTFPTRFRLIVPKTGIRLQFWVRSRRRVFPRLPLVELPPGFNRDFLPNEALEQAFKDACQQGGEALRPPPRPWIDRCYRILLAECTSKLDTATSALVDPQTSGENRNSFDHGTAHSVSAPEPP